MQDGKHLVPPETVPMRDVAFGVVRDGEGFWSVADFMGDELEMVAALVVSGLDELPELKAAVVRRLEKDSKKNNGLNKDKPLMS